MSVNSLPTRVVSTRCQSRYLRFPSLRLAKAYAQAIDTLDESAAYEAETRQLEAAFARLDMVVCDWLSATKCRRDLPLPAWRRR